MDRELAVILLNVINGLLIVSVVGLLYGLYRFFKTAGDLSESLKTTTVQLDETRTRLETLNSQISQVEVMTTSVHDGLLRYEDRLDEDALVMDKLDMHLENIARNKP